MKVRILIAEDHKLVRQGLRRHLEAEPNFALVGEAGDGRSALDMVEKHKPDILLLDLVMPEMRGMEVLARVHERFPKTRVVVLSMHKDKAYVMKAMNAGAFGYVSKHADTTELIGAIQQVARGERYLCPPYTFAELEEYVRRSKNNNGDLLELLTHREKEVLQLLAEGLTNAAAGRKLFINSRTVETHRAHIMSKLALRNFAELVRYAIAKGLVDVPPPADEAGPPGRDPGRLDAGGAGPEAT